MTFRPGEVRRYTPVKPCRDFSRTVEAVYLLRASPGSPFGMKRAQRQTFPDTHLRNAGWLSFVHLQKEKPTAVVSIQNRFD